MGQENNNPQDTNSAAPNDPLVRDALREFVNNMAASNPPKKTRKAKSYLERSPVAEKPHAPSIAKRKRTKKSAEHHDLPFSIEHEATAMKKQVTVEEAPSPLEEFKEEYSLPSNYQTTFVRLIARDPFWLYAYWEIDAKAVEQMKTRLGDEFYRCAYTLRVYDVTLIDFNGTNANYYFDMDELFMNGRYIHVGHDNASYCVETGLRTPDNRFFAFSRSNTVSTHPAGESHRNELIWKEVRNLDQQKAFANLMFPQEKSKLKNYSSLRNDWYIRLSKLPISPNDIRNYYENGNGTTLKSILKKQIRKALGAKQVHLADDIDFEEVTVNEMTQGPYKYSKTYRGGTEEVMKEFLGASEELYFREVRSLKKKSFPFEIEMELTVRGKTLPDAHVSLGNMPIALDKNGTFTLKFSLEDGALPFDFAAQSNKKDLGKNIRTSVIRTKTEEEEF